MEEEQVLQSIDSSEFQQGAPRLKGRDISIAEIVLSVKESGLEDYVKKPGISGKKEGVIAAIIYCRDALCIRYALGYCNNCILKEGKTGRAVWKDAKEVYEQEIMGKLE